jgi:hypothetical protein
MTVLILATSITSTGTLLLLKEFAADDRLGSEVTSEIVPERALAVVVVVLRGAVSGLVRRRAACLRTVLLILRRSKAEKVDRLSSWIPVVCTSPKVFSHLLGDH